MKSGPSQPLVTTVIDVGARYGMHPSWAPFTGELRYIAFEPDAEEARKLRTRYNPSSYEVFEEALGADNGVHPFYITKHRGFSSFRAPDPENFYFKHVCPGESVVEKVVQAETKTLDSVAHSRKLHVDFLKIDTEGSDLDVLRGGKQCITDTAIGLRVELHFQRCFKEQPLFPDIFSFLTSLDFSLVNMDYFGRGEPQHPLFRSPNPILPDNQRYGMVIGTDGIFIRPYEWLVKTWVGGDALARSVFKWAWFCILNHGTDVALNGLQRFFGSTDGKALSKETKESRLYRGLRKSCIMYLGQYRARPESREWALAQELSLSWFEINLEGGSGYWDQIRELD